MFAISIAPQNPIANGHFAGCAGRHGWLHAAATQCAPAAAARVLQGNEDDGLVPVGGPALEAELARLLPWRPRTTVRRNPRVVVCAQGPALHMDVRDATRVDAAQKVADVALARLCDRDGAAAWALAMQRRDFAIVAGGAQEYRLRSHLRLRVSDYTPADLMDFRRLAPRLVYEGLVAAALWTADPAALLARMPGPDADAVVLTRAPDIRQRTDASGHRYYGGLAIALRGFTVEGPWSIGGGLLFGCGRMVPAWRREKAAAAPGAIARIGP